MCSTTNKCVPEQTQLFRNNLIRFARDAPASSAAKAPCARCGGTPLGVEHLTDVPAPQWVRCSRQLILHNLRAPRAVRPRPQLGVAERVRHAHHGVPPPREELFVAVRRGDFHLVPRGCRPVLQPRFCSLELRCGEEAALVQKLANSFAQASRDVWTGENVEQIRSVLRVQRVVRICLPFCTRKP